MEQEQLDLFGDRRPGKSGGLDLDDQKVHFLALSSVRGIGVQTLRRIFERFERFDTVWSLPEASFPRLASRFPNASGIDLRVFLKSNRDSLLRKAKAQLQGYNSKNIDILFNFEDRFPKSLGVIPDAPYWLFTEGDSSLLNRDNMVAVVGSRAASDRGLNLARKVSTILSERGYPIVSGLAEGIDAVAHQTSLDYGNHCVAVLGTGISVVFPASTAGLRARMVRSGGVVITEYLPNDSYSKARFVMRNRIQAALSRVVIPVEWSATGGTARTVQYAEKYGKHIVFLKNVQGNHAPLSPTEHAAKKRCHVIDTLSDNLEQDLLSVLHMAQAYGEVSRVSGGQPAAVLQSVVDEFGRLIESYEVSRDSFDAMVEELRNRWSKKHQQHDH